MSWLGQFKLENAHELDGQEYFPLRVPNENGSEATICLLLHDHLPAAVQKAFDRTGLPVLAVHATTDERHVFVDDEARGHASLAYLLAAGRDEEGRAEAIQLVGDTIQRLLRSHEHRIQRAAKMAYDRIVSPSVTMSGDDYEVDVFSILRVMFPYTYQLGRKGKVEPDGYVCLPNYQSNSIRDVGSWNWSYDSKYSSRNQGYDFNIDECRKVTQYLKKLSSNRRALFGDKQRPRAHVIISNHLAHARMKKCAEHVLGKNGVSGEARQIRLVLMEQSFLVRLFERVQDNLDAIRRRRPFFGDELIALLESTAVGSYRTIDGNDADKLVNAVLLMDPIESNVDEKALLESLA